MRFMLYLLLVLRLALTLSHCFRGGVDKFSHVWCYFLWWLIWSSLVELSAYFYKDWWDYSDVIRFAVVIIPENISGLWAFWMCFQCISLPHINCFCLMLNICVHFVSSFSNISSSFFVISSSRYLGIFMWNHFSVSNFLSSSGRRLSIMSENSVLLTAYFPSQL